MVDIFCKETLWFWLTCGAGFIFMVTAGYFTGRWMAHRNAWKYRRH